MPKDYLLKTRGERFSATPFANLHIEETAMKQGVKTIKLGDGRVFIVDSAVRRNPNGLPVITHRLDVKVGEPNEN